MTQTHREDGEVKAKKSNKQLPTDVSTAKRQMCDALKVRRRELEDRLYDKVQDLKKLCLQEAEIRGKIPWEYIRYLDVDETIPKIKKRVGAEYHVKLRSKHGRYVDRDNATSITIASSSSSGFGSESTDLNLDEELLQLEQEGEILTQIANAAKKLATDRSVKGRIKAKRWKSYKKALQKLQKIEDKIDEVRKKVGQKPSVRASMFIVDDDDEMMFDDGRISRGDDVMSKRSSLSDASFMGDISSLSSRGDVLSTHSSPTSATDSRKSSSPADVDISDLHLQRSLTPPPTFHPPKLHASSGSLKNNNHDNSYRRPLFFRPPSRDSTDSNKPRVTQTMSNRNWIGQKWQVPRSTRRYAWYESSMESVEKTTITMKSDATVRNNVADEVRVPGSPWSVGFAPKVVMRQKKTEKSPAGKLLLTANYSQNNNKEMLLPSKLKTEVCKTTKLKRDVSDGALSELPVKSNPISLPSNSFVTGTSNSATVASTQEKSSCATETSRRNNDRRRSSSLSDAPTHQLHLPRRGHHKANTGTLKSKKQLQSIQSAPKDDAMDLEAFSTQSMQEALHADTVAQSKNSQNLKPPIFDTNINIRMQYMNKRRGHHSYAAPNSTSWNQGSSDSQKEKLHPTASETNASYIPSPTSQTFNQTGMTPPVYCRSSSEDPITTHTTSSRASHTEPLTFPAMTTSQRDNYNEEDYQDLGLSWAPSLTEYSRRASVCESANAHSKKADILKVLENHIALTRASSSVHSKSRHCYKASFPADHRQNVHPSSTVDNQSQTAPSCSLEQTKTNGSSAQPSHMPVSIQSSTPRTKIFLHKLPPTAPSKLPHPLQQNVSNQDAVLQQLPAPTSDKIPGFQHCRWMSQPYVTSDEAAIQSAKKLNTSRGVERSDSEDPSSNQKRHLEVAGGSRGTVVIQSLIKSPDGHEVSVFALTKSAPNTPLPKYRDPLTWHTDVSSHPKVGLDPSEVINEATPLPVSPQTNIIRPICESRDVTDRTPELPKAVVDEPTFGNFSQPSFAGRETVDHALHSSQVHATNKFLHSSDVFNEEDAVVRPDKSPHSPSKKIYAQLAKYDIPSSPEKAQLIIPYRSTSVSSVRAMFEQQRRAQNLSEAAIRSSVKADYLLKDRIPKTWNNLLPNTAALGYGDGTLPRASKSRRKIQRVGNLFLNSEPSQENQREDLYDEKKYRRSVSDSNSAPHRNRRISSEEMAYINFRGDQIAHKSDSSPSLLRYNTDPKPVHCDQHLEFRDKKFSSSFEDLLWTGTGDNQSGTLV